MVLAEDVSPAVVPPDEHKGSESSQFLISAVLKMEVRKEISVRRDSQIPGTFLDRS